MTSLQLFHRRHMPGGANVPHFKNTTECATALLPTPSKVCIPMQQHIGAPCEPVVKVGETVKAGQLIGDSPSPVSAPIHASISGKVTAIDEILMPFGAKCTSVTITSDGENTVDETLQPPEIKDREDFLNAIRASGLVGLGGAGFPTSVKLNPKNIQEVNTLIINGAECEPFITSDYREFMENADDVIEGILLVQKFLEMKEVYIGIENNKPEAIIPLDLSKRPRAYQILSQIISGFAKDEPDNGSFGSASTSVLRDEIDSLNNKFDTLISLMTELVNGDQVTNINVDGRTIARATNSAFRAQNALDIERKRRGFSGV